MCKASIIHQLRFLCSIEEEEEVEDERLEEGETEELEEKGEEESEGEGEEGKRAINYQVNLYDWMVMQNKSN